MFIVLREVKTLSAFENQTLIIPELGDTELLRSAEETATETIVSFFLFFFGIKVESQVESRRLNFKSNPVQDKTSSRR